MAITRRSVLRSAVAAGAVATLGVDRSAAASAMPQKLPGVDVLVVGGGTGGVAAALALLQGGRTVVLTEPTGWIGGQLTSQAVPPDEHSWIEEGIGATRLYLDMREMARQYFKDYYPVTKKARDAANLDPGQHWSLRLSLEPFIWHEVLRGMFEPYVASGRLRILLNSRPISATRSGKVVTEVRFATPNGEQVIKPRYVVEATELGDLLPLANIPHIVGREKGGADNGGTGELHNPWDYADPMCQQAFTVVAAVGYTPTRLGEPVRSPLFKEFEPIYRTFGRNGRDVFDPSRNWLWNEGRNFWQYRRARYAGHLVDRGFGDITLLNQPENDCVDLLLPAAGPTDPSAYAATVERGNEQTRGLVEYFQRAHPRPDGRGNGWSRLFLAPSSVGSSTGLALYPYIRESRRILSHRPILEYHVGVDARQARFPGAKAAHTFSQSVGIGAGPIDIHTTAAYPHGLHIPTYPFQIPLGALVPREVTNVLVGGKAIGTTHITNGCYRYHPVEWNIGESAGHALAFALNRNLQPTVLLTSAPTFAQFATYLDRRGVQRNWPKEIRPKLVASLAD